MTENMPVLYRNIMDGLPSDFAREVFLWAVERPNEDRYCYRAERFALEAHDLVGRLKTFLDMGAKVHGLECYDPDLLNFVMKRHANWRCGSNMSPGYSA